MPDRGLLLLLLYFHLLFFHFSSLTKSLHPVSAMEQSSGMIIALVIVFTILELVFVALRVTARLIKKVSLGIDDYLILVAGVSRLNAQLHARPTC